MALVAAFARLGWPMRIGLLVLVLVVAAGYLVLRARRGATRGLTDPGADQGDDAVGDPAAEALAHPEGLSTSLAPQGNTEQEEPRS